MDLKTATIPRGALCVLSFLCLSAAAALAANPPIERMELSTVRIFVKQGDSYGTGSGFIVGDGSYVVTNHHVIDHADGIAVLAKQLKIPATSIVADDPAKDLAIIRLKENSGRPPVTLGLRAGVKKTQTIIAAGFPGAADDGPTDDDSLLEVKFSKGIISAFVRSKSGTLLYQIDAAINPGNSDGLLFDECGRVVGVDAMKSLIPAVVVGADGKPTPERVPYGEGVAWAIQADELLDLLQTAGINPRASSTACGESASAPPPGPKKRTGGTSQPQTPPDHSGEKGQPKETATARNLLIAALVAIALLALRWR
jgi:S1-C subfamily serine protease